MNNLERLHALIPMLLEEDAPQFTEALERWREDPEKFLEEGLLENSGIGKEDLAELDPESEQGQIEILLAIAEDLAYTLYLDWQGEESEGDFEIWVEGRMRAFGESFDSTFVEDWKEQVDLDSLQRGEYIRHKFRLVGDHLAGRGYMLIDLDLFGDDYRLFLLRKASWESIFKPVQEGPDEEEEGLFFGLKPYTELTKDLKS